MLRISEAHIWAKCPGSTKLRRVEKPKSETAREGDLCHRITELMIKGDIRPADTIETINARKDLSSFGLVVTPEHRDMAFEAAVYCCTLTDDIKLTEQPVMGGSLPVYITGVADFIGYKEGTLHVVDIKFGYGVVEAEDNPQLLLYSLGARDIVGQPISAVELHIVQPRDFVNGPSKKVRLDMAEWRRKIDDLLERGKRAVEDTATCTGVQCRYCLSRIYCPGFIKHCSELAETVVLSPEGLEIPRGAYGSEYEYLLHAESMITAARKAFEDVMMNEIEQGRPVPGWTVGRSPGRRYWSASMDELKSTAAMFGLELTQERPISITDAWRNSSARPLIESLVSKSEGAKKLIRFDGTKTEEKFK